MQDGVGKDRGQALARKSDVLTPTRADEAACCKEHLENSCAQERMGGKTHLSFLFTLTGYTIHFDSFECYLT